MKNKKTILFPLALCTLLLSFIFSGCSKGGPIAPYTLDLEVWGVFDNSGVFQEANELYAKQSLRINKVKYKKISSDAKDFEKELIDAMASNKAPDIIYLKNSWLPKHKERLSALPDSESYLVKNKDQFINVFFEDYVEEEDGNRKVYAMPLYSDTLVLYYNKDMFNQSGLAYPPKTWDEVKDYTKKLTRIDNFGNITQSAIALGRSKNPGGINRSADILSLLMMQNGAIMSKNDQVNFAMSSFADANPALSALSFYTQFAQGDSDVYTWNSKMDYSIDSFRYRKVAMMINYAYMYDKLKKMDPKLNFDIAPVPQVNLDRKVNYADYWGLAVIKNKEIASQTYTNKDRIKEAWNYIKFITNKPSRKGFDPGKTYLDEANKISARKDLLEEQRNDSFRNIFAEQALTAKSWRRPDDFITNEIMVNMIDNVVSGNMTANRAIDIAISRINTINK